MKFAHTGILLSMLVIVSGRATQSSESESVSSSKSSSSEQIRNDYESDLIKINGKNSTVEEVLDTETAKKVDLKKFDDTLKADGELEGYVQKRTKAQTNGTENLNDDEVKVFNVLEKTMSSDSEEEHVGQKNGTVLGIDTFGAQGI